MTRINKKNSQFLGIKPTQHTIPNVSIESGLFPDHFGKEKPLDSNIPLHTYNQHENRAQPEHIRLVQASSRARVDIMDENEDESDEQQPLTPPTMLRRNKTNQTERSKSSHKYPNNQRKYTNSNIEPVINDADELTHDQIIAGKIPSTAPMYSQVHVHRLSNSFISVVQPIDVFKTFPPYNRKKVLGFIRQNGPPLMYSLPGSKICVDDHPRMLNSEIWTKEVKFWAKAHNVKFKTYMWDFRHGTKTFFASHVELRLMLWFASDLLFKITGSQPISLREQIGDTFRLRTLTQGVKAEIVLSKAPCSSCLRFTAKFEEYTGLKFTFAVIGNVGPLKESRDKNNIATLDGFASLSDSDDSESEFEMTRKKAVEYSQEKNSLQVVIRRKGATKVKEPLISQPFNVQVDVNDRPLHSRSHGQNSKRVDVRQQIKDQSDSDFEPPPTKKSISKRVNAPMTPTRGNRCQPNASHCDPFNLEARAFAEKIKNGKGKKRKQDNILPSPISARKATRQQYFD